MDNETLKQNLIKYKETFGTPYNWMAKRFGVDKSVFSYFINDIDRKISDNAMQKIKDGYKTLIMKFEEM